jgi:hypothetical protein
LNTFLFGQLLDGERVRSMKHAGQKAKCLHFAIARRHKYEMWRFTISPEIDLWRNQRQLERHRVEIFIALSCREVPLRNR